MSFIINIQSAIFVVVAVVVIVIIVVSLFCLLQCLFCVAIVVCCLVCMWIESYKHELIVAVILSASQAKVCWLFVVYKAQHSLWHFSEEEL